MPLLHPILQKSLWYETVHMYFASRSDMLYISFLEDDNVLSCVVFTGYFCRLDTALHSADKVQDYSWFCFENDKDKIIKDSYISLLNQIIDHAISIDKKLLGNDYIESMEVVYYLSYIFIPIYFKTSFWYYLFTKLMWSRFWFILFAI